jgi:hypothetical protein
MTSAVPVQRTVTAALLGCIALKTSRTSVEPGSVGSTTAPHARAQLIDRVQRREVGHRSSSWLV